jgi:hypothetical protein
MLSQPPAMAERILDAPASITPELIGKRHNLLTAGIDRSLPGCIHIFGVHKEGHRRATQ